LARKKRTWAPNAFYHIICRGNRRDPLFLDAGDYKTFLHMIRKVHEKAPFELASYCLMTNHFHLQLRSTDQPISKIMSLVNKRYADYYNTKYNLTGHVFEKRYFDEIIEPGTGMLKVSRYIHLNPVKAKIVDSPEQYPWSSYRHYLHTLGNDFLALSEVLAYFSGNEVEKREQYKEFMKKVTEEEEDEIQIG
jgi:putative transposase